METFISEALNWLLDQSAVAVVMGFGYYLQHKERLEEKKEHKEERQTLQEEIKNLNDKAKEEAIQNLKAMLNLEVMIEGIEEDNEKILTLLNNKT